MTTSNRSGVVDIETPYGLARVNAAGQILWAEWEVWRHCEEFVEAGIWTSRESTSRGRQRQVFFLVKGGDKAEKADTDKAMSAAPGAR